MLRGCSLAKMEQLDSVPDMDFELPNGSQQTIKGSIDLRAVTDSRGKEGGRGREQQHGKLECCEVDCTSHLTLSVASRRSARLLSCRPFGYLSIRNARYPFARCAFVLAKDRDNDAFKKHTQYDRMKKEHTLTRRHTHSVTPMLEPQDAGGRTRCQDNGQQAN